MTIELIPTDASALRGRGLDAILDKMADAQRLWRAQDGSDTVGIAGFLDLPEDQTAEIGYGVAPDHRGSGHAHSIAAALQDQARSMGLTGLRARSLESNTASAAVLRRAGFQLSHVSRSDGGSPVCHWVWSAAS